MATEGDLRTSYIQSGLYHHLCPFGHTQGYSEKLLLTNIYLISVMYRLFLIPATVIHTYKVVFLI